jgi:hypothetical protein
MRAFSAGLLLLVAGCATPAYFVRAEDLGAAVTPAVREDGSAAKLRGESYRAVGAPPRADGLIEVRGPGRHGWRYKSGAIVLGVSIALAAGGAALALGTIGCVSDSCPGGSGGNQNASWAGFGISIAGDVGTFIIGPAIMISAGWQRPVEP